MLNRLKLVLLIDCEALAGSDLLQCAIFGGVISCIGSELTIRFGGAIDGIDVLSVIFSKKIGVSIGTFVMIFNTILYIICGITIKIWILPLYSIVTYYICSRTVDFVVDLLIKVNTSECNFTKLSYTEKWA